MLLYLLIFLSPQLIRCDAGFRLFSISLVLQMQCGINALFVTGTFFEKIKNLIFVPVDFETPF